jgi:hypothetical protein
MCCINHGNFDYGQSRSGQLSQKLLPSTQRNSLVQYVLPPAELKADSVKRSSRAHLFHFYIRLCEIASVPRKAPSAWISADRLDVLPGVPAEKEKEIEPAATGWPHHPGSDKWGPCHLVSFDVRELARKCSNEVGRELGVP